MLLKREDMLFLISSAQMLKSTFFSFCCLRIQFGSYRNAFLLLYALFQTGLMGKALLEFQSNKGDLLPAHKVLLSLPL